MAGELTIADWSGTNVGNTNFSAPNVCVDIDVANSTAIITAVALPAGAAAECIGVVHDKSKLNPDGTVVKNSGVAIRTWGIIRVTCSAGVTAGQYLAISGANGQVSPKAQAIAGAQPGAIVGRALTNAASGEKVLVLLMIGARY